MLFTSPEEHAAHPPSSWTVERVMPRLWALKAGDVTLANWPTRKAAEGAKVSGLYVTMYERESRWYAGEPVPGWKPYEQVKAERERNERWQAERRAAREAALR